MKWMSMREFLRGGYRTLTEPTVVANHGRPAFTVFPHDGTVTISLNGPERPPDNAAPHSARGRTTVR